MGRIRVLDAQTASAIAAGEVVERPASIVKELVENAVDAGATNISVAIKNGGIDLIRIADNGSGIPPEDIRMAFVNHATSKLTSADQLSIVDTLGFRGEALPSIAAVARIEALSRCPGSDVGVRLRIEGGNVLDIAQVGCPDGTTFIIKDIFFNTPARHAFLKKPVVEQGYIAEVMLRAALCCPSIAVSLTANDKQLLRTSGSGDLKRAAFEIYGREVAESLRNIDSAIGGLRVFGLIGVGGASRNNRSEQLFFLNRRVIRSSMLSQALETAVREWVPTGMFPMCALNIILPFGDVDVNVHPNKLSVRFRNEATIRDGFMEAIVRGMPGCSAVSLVPSVKDDLSIPETDVVQAVLSPTLPNIPREIIPAVLRLREDASALMPPIVKGAETIFNPEPIITAPTYRTIGVLFRTYLLIEAGENLYIIDQHAAHERLLYDAYMQRYGSAPASQALLVPEVVSVTQLELAIFEENRALLTQCGYEIEPFGEGLLKVSAVPMMLGAPKMSAAISALFEEISGAKSRLDDARREAIVRAACKSAVKAHDALTDEEICALVERLSAHTSPPTCPHGRPIAEKITRKELEKRFKRIL